MTTRNLFNNLSFILLALVFSVCQGHAAEEGQTFLDSAEFEKIFRELVTHNAPWPKNDLAIAKFSVKPASLRVPPGTVSYRLLNQTHSERLGSKMLYVAVLVDGQEIDRIKMKGVLQLYGEVVCITKQLDRNALLTMEDVTIIRRDISKLDTRMVTSKEQAIGKQLKTSLRPGSILYSHLLANPPLVKRGDLVTIVARSGQVRVSTPGEVRNKGALGELIRVKNLMSRREIFARVLGAGLVETEL